MKLSSLNFNKTKKHITYIFLSIIILSCSSSYNITPEISKQNLKGKIKSVKQISYSVNEFEKDKIIEKKRVNFSSGGIYYNPNNFTKTIINKEGLITEKTFLYVNDSINKQYQYIYNDKNNVISIIIKKRKINAKYSLSYENGTKKEIRDTIYGPYKSYEISYKYDDNSNLVSKLTSNKNFTEKIIYSYNKDNYLIKESRYYNKDYKHYDNNLIHKSTSGANNTKSIIYTYNSHNNLIKETYFHNDEIYKISNYLYDIKHRLSTAQYFNSEENFVNDKWRYKTTFTYGKNGKLLRKSESEPNEIPQVSEYNKEGLLIKDQPSHLIHPMTYTYKFDKHGNWVEKTAFTIQEPQYQIIRHIEYYN